MRISGTNSRDPAPACGGVPTMGIVASAITLLSTSAAVAWLIHGAVAPATAQSGQRVAATHPEALMTEPWARLPDNPRAAGELPAIDRIAFEFRAGRSTEVDGKATAGAQVVLLRGGERIGETVARADGTWRLTVERGLGVGDHRLQVTSQRPGGGDERLGDAVRVSVPSTLTGPVVVMFGAVPDAASNIPARGIDGDARADDARGSSEADTAGAAGRGAECGAGLAGAGRPELPGCRGQATERG